jgi:hypothetical protein
MAGTVENPGVLNTFALWEQHVMALDRVTGRLQRIASALNNAKVPYALAGGQAVAVWVASRDPAAVRTTKDVDLVVDRADLSRIRAATSSDFDYFETMGVGMLLERSDPNPRHGVHLIWAGEKVRAHEPHPIPSLENRTDQGEMSVVSLRDLVFMKVLANRDQDRVHLRDMIDVGLIDRSILPELPDNLSRALGELLAQAGR